jgi:hypothetical protein
MAVQAGSFPKPQQPQVAVAWLPLPRMSKSFLDPSVSAMCAPHEHNFNFALGVQNGSVANTVFHSEWLHRLSMAHIDARRSLRKAPIPSSKPPPLRPRKPPRPSSTFVGRETILADMKRALCKPNPSPRAVYVLSGVGGAGKTQIMSKFAKDEGSW